MTNRDVNPAAITISSLDEQLLQKALECAERNLSNTEYSVYQLSLDMHMDRTVLYKKVHSITGLTPSEFIRTLRLKRAAQLLEQGNYPVAEVSENGWVSRRNGIFPTTSKPPLGCCLRTTVQGNNFF